MAIVVAGDRKTAVIAHCAKDVESTKLSTRLCTQIHISFTRNLADVLSDTFQEISSFDRKKGN